jgi:hypothetical protein
MASSASITDHPSPVYYQIPTHLSVPDRLSLPMLGFTIQVTMRQGLVLLVGGSLAFRLWHQLEGWATLSTTIAVLRWLVVGLLLLFTGLWAFCTIGGQSLEDWLVVWLRYQRRPRVLLWRPLSSVYAQPTSGEHRQPSGAIRGDVQEDDEQAWALWNRRVA